MFKIVLRPICFAAGAAAAVVLLFGSLFGDIRDSGRWSVPTEAQASGSDDGRRAVAQINAVREPDHLWSRRAPRALAAAGESSVPVARALPLDRMPLELAAQPADVESELRDRRDRDARRAPRPGPERQRQPMDEEWLRVHTPPRPPQFSADVPESVEQRLSREPGPGATVIVADAATNYDLDGRLVLFEGGVRLDGPDFSLASERLDVHMGEGGAVPEKMVAYGDVRVTTRKDEGSGDGAEVNGRAQRATFDPDSGLLVLEGWPQLDDPDGSRLTASQADTVIRIYTRTGKVETTGRTRSRLSLGSR